VTLAEAVAETVTPVPDTMDPAAGALSATVTFDTVTPTPVAVAYCWRIARHRTQRVRAVRNSVVFHAML